MLFEVYKAVRFGIVFVQRIPGFSLHLIVLALYYCKKNKLSSVFYASVLLLMINCVITLSKFAPEITHLRLLICTAL